MAETLSLLADVPSSHTDWRVGSGSAGQLRVLPAEPAIRLRQALAAFDRARSYEEDQAARERVLALGREVVPSVLLELSHGQDPDRFDLLLSLLVRWETPDTVIELVQDVATNWVLRGALAEALGRFVDGSCADHQDTNARIALCLERLVSDPDVGVRIAAVEAIGLSGLALTPDLREALDHAAATDRNDAVRKEARLVLEESAC